MHTMVETHRLQNLTDTELRQRREEYVKMGDPGAKYAVDVIDAILERRHERTRAGRV